MLCFLTLSHTVLLLCKTWGFEDLTHVSGEINHKWCSLHCSLGSVTAFFVIPIKPLFNHCCRNVCARCTEVLAAHSLSLKDRDVLPTVCTLTYIKLKIHLEIPGRTCRLQKIPKHQQMEKTFNSTNLCLQNSNSLGGLCLGGGPAWHTMSVDCVQCEYQL